MTKSQKTMTTICPSCDELVQFNTKPKIGDFTICRECKETLKVAGLSPLRVNWYFPDDEQSWSDSGAGNRDGDDINTSTDQFNWD